MHDLEDLILWQEGTESPHSVATEEQGSQSFPSTSQQHNLILEAVDLGLECLIPDVESYYSEFCGLPSSNGDLNYDLEFSFGCEDAVPTDTLGPYVFDTPPQSSATSSTPDTANGVVSNSKESSSSLKSRTRFSRQSIQILKQWLLLNNRNPYPDDEQKAMLQHQTGLDKTQLSNWLANARRRGKVQPSKPALTYASKPWMGSIDIPRRPPTPALGSNMQNMNPLQRWVDSPPENEPASVDAIARAVASEGQSFEGLNSPTDEAPQHPLHHATSASSAGTSSGGSFASAYSNDSFGSEISWGCAQLRGRRRRRRRALPARGTKTLLITPLNPYQCTFCSETFKTKHIWQRHEKSLHLSLERWICAREGPRYIDSKTNQTCCVFCAMVDPDDAHIESHNHLICTKKPLEERTFHRKDHLSQHLRLVHDAKFLDWCMQSWKLTTSEIRSRCGFCGIVIESWPARTEHLADHFKRGKTMGDWKGDWGFEPQILDMLKNAIPPYLIEMERSSTIPFVAGAGPTESPCSAYELIAIELGYFMVNYQEEQGMSPSNKEMRFEACRIIFASEVQSPLGLSTELSWLRDLLMASRDIAKQARFAPLRHGAENRLCTLRINGKDNLFEQCPLELQLSKFVDVKRLLDLVVTDDELQQECCRIVGRFEDASATPCDFMTKWLVRLIMSSTSWLSKFRKRVHLPPSEDNAAISSGQVARNSLDGTMNNNGRLDESMFNHTPAQPALSIQSSSSAALDPAVQRIDHGRSPRFARNFEGMLKSTFFLNDTNCYRHLAQDLTRFVTSAMSPHNPNQHVPSDAEIQYQARWILFDSDDPWNQTAADNPEWLKRFKSSVGILPPGSG